MGAADVVIALVFLALFLLPALKKVLEAAAEQGQGADRERARAEHEASPEQIRDFLQSLASERQQPRRVQAEQQRAAGTGRGDAAERKAPPPPPGRPRGISSQGRRGRSASMERAERRLARARERAEEVVAEAGSPEEMPSPGVQPGRQRPTAVPSAGGKFSLKQAVVWSEILRPPVSLRRSHSHVPPAARK